MSKEIKLPVHKSLKVGSAYFFEIFDADGESIADNVYEPYADQIITALNAQQPCKTCLDCKEIKIVGTGEILPCPDCQQAKCEICGDTGKPCSACGEFHSKDVMCPPHEVRFKGKDSRNAPCPRCGKKQGQPAEAGELVKNARKLIGTDSIGQSRYISLLRQSLEQAAARLETLEGALEKHKHTDECFAYAAKTSKASGVYHCIAKCWNSYKAALGKGE